MLAMTMSQLATSAADNGPLYVDEGFVEGDVD